MLSITCRDVGQNCDCVVQGETEEEHMKNAARNTQLKIMVTRMTPEMKERIKSHIHKS